MLYYFFSGTEYIAVERGDVGHGAILPGYPRPISDWGWGTFGSTGIDAALYSGSKCYFFKESEYIRVTRGATDFGTVDPGFPRPISDWGWSSSFGATGIDAAMWSGSVCYFFKGSEYVRVHRDDTSMGTVDAGYPKIIDAGWLLGSFAADGIDAALYSGAKAYMFAESNYVQISEGDLESLNNAFDDSSHNISEWGWESFGSSGIDAALNSPGPLAAPPQGGARSNQNFVLHAGGDILTGVTVSIAFDETAQVDPHPPGLPDTGGWAIQLNCYSLSAPSTKTLWQQYIIESPPGTGAIAGHINNWTSASDNGDEINFWLELVEQMPAVDTLARGTFISISPQNDSAGSVIGCTFTITYNSIISPPGLPGLTFPVTASIYMNMLDSSLWHDRSGNAITNDELAPIVAMELNIVGHLDRSDTHFTSGAGTINYAAAQKLTVSDEEPDFTHFGGYTGETSNMTYGPLPAGYTSNPTQSFRADTLPHLKPGIGNRKGVALATKRPLNPANEKKKSINFGHMA
jgi:hypothetical protein